MTGELLLAVPNISEGRDVQVVRDVTKPAGEARLIDLHTDPDHNRSVATFVGPPDALAHDCIALVLRAAARLDLRTHSGAHPRHGVADVVPFVPYRATETAALEAAELCARGIAEAEIRVYRYGTGTDRSLPELRRMLRGAPPAPDHGPRNPHPTAGTVCVGVRDPLVAFNVQLRARLDDAGAIAASIREGSAGPYALPGVRALGFELPSRRLVQVSMNLTRPLEVGPRAAFDRVSELARDRGVEVVDAEVVGLVPDELRNDTDGLPLRTPAKNVAAAADEPPRPPTTSGSGR